MGRRDAVHVSHLNGQSKRRRIKVVKKSAYFSLGLLRIPRRLQRQLLSPLATRHALAAAGTGPQWKTHFRISKDFVFLSAALRPARYVEKITEYLFYFILSLIQPGTQRTPKIFRFCLQSGGVRSSTWSRLVGLWLVIIDSDSRGLVQNEVWNSRNSNGIHHPSSFQGIPEMTMKKT